MVRRIISMFYKKILYNVTNQNQEYFITYKNVKN